MTKAFSFYQVKHTTKPLLLLAFLSLSSAWAGAFNSGITSPINIKVGTSSTSFVMKSPPGIARDPASSPSFLSLSTLLFLRGGDNSDQDTVATSDETASLGADSMHHRQANYGAQESVDVEMTESQPAAVEEDADPSSPIKSFDDFTSPVATRPSPLLSAMAPISAVLQTAATFYTQQLTARPIVTKSLTAGIIFGLSDWCAQLIERGEGDEDGAKSPLVFSRIFTTFLVGLLFFGPAANAWYAMIFKVLPSTSLISTLQKAALGQIFFGPAFTCVFFAAGMIQSGSFSLGAWLSQIKSDLPAVWVSGLGFWPLVDFISYKVVPVQWIPLFVNFCSFVWTIYLSLVANKGKSAEA